MKRDAAANIRAAAALLRAHGDSTGARGGDIGSWSAAIARFSGIAIAEGQDAYVRDVLAVLDGRRSEPVSAEASIVASGACTTPPPPPPPVTDQTGSVWRGSPNFNAAAEWTVKQMTEWGFTNGRLEPWDFVNADDTPRDGWLNERFSGHIVAPVKDSLVGEVLAWTPSTAGTVEIGRAHV